ncbi:UDP-N-acetylglucosamine--N-acetylmuramyl-(pentapeptide) pyrophosphoryl-undecaprenol N-acetylglucosamine transferase [BD1-7 clade bacterium]|uniref:UDP-N-acetylglucosamine--N-acetylmuramyl-(Pentapeptide) pyrophosphoryl-undecaprenol N-acetylglucosamine transferase n=1 Tax=BD1-7 clade bacterium TaxID=2029982 RepID=A0A5S9QZ93_9GAMM|nr:UDP-N-acetylglucosamine--N-acetylmuramyl-(pentapeptide) pyrophosphoryl-undecaprenol N-acetylglucosamine transferase [BD1-7 clade bacterium]
MKVFLTVGTTRFDSLVRSVDAELNRASGINMIFQTADTKYVPLNGESFDFAVDIEQYYHNADLVVTHAGAGSIYKLLEMNKKIIVVPNLERIDSHQKDIAEFLEENNYAMVAWDVKVVVEKIEASKKFTPAVYKKRKFFGAPDMARYINAV